MYWRGEENQTMVETPSWKTLATALGCRSGGVRTSEWARMGCRRRASKTLPLSRSGDVNLVLWDLREGYRRWTTPSATKSRLLEVFVRVVRASKVLLWLLATIVLVGGGRRINGSGGLVALIPCCLQWRCLGFDKSTLMIGQKCIDSFGKLIN